MATSTSTPNESVMEVHPEVAQAEAGHHQAAFMAARMPVWDTAKGFLVFCVIWFHAGIVLFPRDEWTEGPSSLMITFLLPMPMPTLCLISGHLSSVDLEYRRRVAIWRTLASFVVLQTIAVGGVGAMGGWSDLPVPFFESFTFLWYLFAMTVWRMLLPFTTMMRAPVASALVVGHATLFIDTASNSMVQAVLCFQPFFLAGFYTTSEHLETLRRPALRRLLFAVFFVSSLPAVVVQATKSEMESFSPTLTKILEPVVAGCFYGDRLFNTDCRWPRILGLPLVYLKSFAGTYALLGYLPKRKVPIVTIAGVLSYYLYILHIPILLGTRFALAGMLGVSDKVAVQRVVDCGWPGRFGVIGFTILLYLLLTVAQGCRPVLWWLLEPRVELILATPD